MTSPSTCIHLLPCGIFLFQIVSDACFSKLDKKGGCPDTPLFFPVWTLTFDEAYWKAYWPIVNEPVLKVRDVMMNIDKERRENEMKKMSENKRTLEEEEAERLEATKKQEELRRRKRKKNVESPTQSPFPSSPDSTPEKMKSSENEELTPSNLIELQCGYFQYCYLPHEDCKNLPWSWLSKDKCSSEDMLLHPLIAKHSNVPSSETKDTW